MRVCGRVCKSLSMWPMLSSTHVNQSPVSFCRYWSHPHEQRPVHRQGEVSYRVFLQSGATLQLQTQPGRSNPLQRAQHWLAGYGEGRTHIRTCLYTVYIHGQASLLRFFLLSRSGASGRRQGASRGPCGGADGGRRSEALGVHLQ